jgi:apolipoprotein N-acyltransferase
MRNVHHSMPMPAYGTTLTARLPTARAAAIGAPGAFALAALSGMAHATAFPPLSWSVVAWVALAPLLVACAALPPRRAAMAGMCWALTAGAGATWFLPTMLSGYFGMAPLPSGLAAVAIVCGLHGVYVSGYAAWVAWLARRGAANPWLLAGGWLACEVARAHGPGGVPWAITAYSQLGWTSLVQIADLAGPHGIGLLVAAVNAGVAAFLVPALRGRRPVLAATTIAAALVGTLVYGEWRLGQTFGDGPALGVAVVQAGATSPSPADRGARLARHVELTTRAAAARPRLVVWPEYALETYLQEGSPTRDAVLATADRTGGDLIVGGPHYAKSAAGTRHHNSAFLVRDGRVAARYDKHRLVPFAEDDRLAWLVGAVPSGYAPGDGSFVLPATDVRAGVLVCLEAMFPELAREAVRQGAEVLVNLSNDAWLGGPAPARQQLDIAALRAVENRRWVVRAATTGFSAVIDPYGRTVTSSTFDAHQVLHATVRASRARTPYQRWGDALAWLAIAGVALATSRALFTRSVAQQLKGRSS